MKFVFSIMAFLFFSCNNPDGSVIKIKITSPSDSLRKTIIGNWGGLGEASPVFEIKKDSIYYFAQMRSYPYEIVDGDLWINFSNSKAILKNIRTIKDTLLFEDNLGILTKGYRFK